MRRIFGLLTLVVLTTVTAAAQGIVKEGNIYFGDKTAAAWLAPAKSDLDLAKKNLAKYAKKNLSVNLKTDGKDILIAREVAIETIASKRGDMVVKLFDENGATRIGVSFMMGYDISINSREYPVEMGNLKLFVTEFLKYHYKEYYEQMIDEETKKISQVNKEIKKNERTIAGLNKVIMDGEDQIAAGPGPEEKLKINNKIIEDKSKRESLMAINLNLRNEITRLEYNVGLNNNELNGVDMTKF